MELLNSIDTFVEKNLRSVRYIHANSVVTDPIYGSFELFPWEATLCTTPLMQRLKRIHQMGVAFHVYLGAVHHRFQHSLGTTFLAGEVLRGFRDKFEMVSEVMVSETRLAALLHDIGHSPFSHLGERFWNQNLAFQQLKNEDRFAGAKPHEIISCLIVESEAFRSFWLNLTNKFEELTNSHLRFVTLKRIANRVIGSANFEPSENWLTRIINGSQIPDVDRLDYLVRDSYFSGLNTTIDVRGIIRSFSTSATGNGHFLAFDPSIVPVFERMLFNKAQLYGLIYHNSNVLGLEQTFLKACNRLLEVDEDVGGVKPSSNLFLLDTDDMLWLFFNPRDRIAGNLLDRLRNGQGMVPSLVISRSTIGERTLPNLLKFIQLNDGQIKDLEREIARRACSNCSEWDVSICIPSLPSFRESNFTMLKVGNEIIPLDAIFPIDRWIQAYVAPRWKAFIFSTEIFKEKVHAAASKVLSDMFGISFGDG